VEPERHNAVRSSASHSLGGDPRQRASPTGMHTRRPTIPLPLLPIGGEQDRDAVGGRHRSQNTGAAHDDAVGRDRFATLAGGLPRMLVGGQKLARIDQSRSVHLPGRHRVRGRPKTLVSETATKAGDVLQVKDSELCRFGCQASSLC